MTSFRLISILFVLLFSSNQALASGGYGGSATRLNVPVDERYEYGKAIFKGRVKDIGKIKYCIDTGEEKKKLKKKTLKPFKRQSREQLADSLYDCKSPETAVSARMSRSQLFDLVYYLNKRYKLKLR